MKWDLDENKSIGLGNGTLPKWNKNNIFGFRWLIKYNFSKFKHVG
jgi:hypothetical protein